MDTRLAIAFERTHIPDQSLLRSIQSVLRAMLGLDSVIGQAVPGGRAQEARNEQIYGDLMATGDRLLSLLRSEFEAIPVDPNQAPSDTINRWRACRRSVDHLVENYVESIDQWRARVHSESRRFAQSKDEDR